jgi:UDP-galactopyranose mutase
VQVVVPEIPDTVPTSEIAQTLENLIAELISTQGITRYDLWYYTPMALPFTRTLYPEIVVYDCMDELSGFKGAPTGIRDLEAALFSRADLVFTGGRSLHEVKSKKHPSAHCFPSSIEVDHFRRARQGASDPADQHGIPGPRCGFYGVVDERFDVDLLAAVADRAAHWHFVVIGPVIKISPERLPSRANIHYLGQKTYRELPDYLSGWEVAMMPFAHNSATRFISPTKTPEYLAAGCAVVSTSIRDVVRPYGEQGLVSIADTPSEFARAIDFERKRRREDNTWRRDVDAQLMGNSWDKTWIHMSYLMERARAQKLSPSPLPSAGAELVPRDAA